MALFCLSRRLVRLKAQMSLETVDEDDLRRVELDTCQFWLDPLDTVDLGIATPAHLKCPWDQPRGVEVGFDGPRHDHLSRLERGVTESNPLPGRHLPSRFLGKLPRGRLLGFLIGLHDPLDDGPPAIVPPREIGPAGVRYQHFETLVASVREKTRGSHSP
jgi:hypothetical protein